MREYTEFGICEHSNFDKNADPNVVRPLKGMSACTATVLPGTVLLSGPD